MAKAEGVAIKKLSFPTIMAVEGGKLQGFVATHLKPDMIIAGPLVICSDQPRPKLMLRLAELYENAMRNMGIKSFIMVVREGSTMHRAIQRYTAMEPYGRDGDDLLFVRRV